MALFIPLAHAGLALATSLAAWMNAGLLFYMLYRTKVYRFQPGWPKFIQQMLLANTALCAFYYWISPKIDSWLSWSWELRLMHLFPLLLGAIVLYFSVLWLAGMRWHELNGKAPGYRDS